MALIHIGFFSETLGMCVNCDVILPQRATKQIGLAAAERGGKHPVLWLLHGASDDHTIWQRRTSIERYASELGLAVVMPAAHLSSYSNMVHGGRFYDYIAEELPETMRGFFPLSDRREENFIAGLSMGGNGALRIGLSKPEAYAAIGCLSSGARHLNKKMSTSEAWARRMQMNFGDGDISRAGEETYDYARAIIAEKRPAPRVYHACGSEDFLIENVHDTRDFFQSLTGNPFDYIYEEMPGAHTWDFWDETIQHFLNYIKLPPVKGVRN